MATNYLTREYCGLVKNEGTPGTAEALTNAEGKIIFLDLPTITRNVAYIDIPAQQGLGHRKGTSGARGGQWTLAHHFAGKGATGVPDWLPLAKSCGLVFTGGSGVPTKNATTTATLGRYVGAGSTARYETLVGAMGNCVVRANAGEPARLEYTMTGCLPVGTSDTPPTITYPTVTPPRWANAAALKIGGTEYPAASVEFDFGNNVVLLPNPNTLSGYAYAYITNRTPIIRVSPTAFDFGTLNYLSGYFAGTEREIIITIGTATNNILTITAPKCQLQNPPADGDRDGVMTDDLVFQCNQDGDTEDSEYTFVLS